LSAEVPLETLSHLGLFFVNSNSTNMIPMSGSDNCCIFRN
jgi:hypothetical protein